MNSTSNQQLLSRLQVCQGDITQVSAEVVVNAANSALSGGAGVDDAIHSAAGSELQTFCQNMGGCEVGSAKLTPAFNLPARAIIHAVGPIWQGGEVGEEATLTACYYTLMKVAANEGFQSIAIPAISCGAYGYPVEKAVKVAIACVLQSLRTMPLMQQVIFCCLQSSVVEQYRTELTMLEGV